MTPHNPDFRRFFVRLLVFSLPMLCVIACYVALDPFKVVWHYERYFEDNTAHPALNMGNVSTENFAGRNPRKHYNAFIFGNSRSQYWRTDDWKRHIGRDNRCYHYYGNGESLGGMERYVRFVNASGNRIDHALLVVDADLLGQTKSHSGHLFCTPPRVAGLGGAIRFHADNFTAFLNPAFARAFLDLLFTGRMKDYMLEQSLIEQPVVYHPDANEVEDRMFDQSISHGTYYTEARLSRFRGVQHPDSISPPVLREENIRLLQSIARIFRQHGTSCRIAISPLYNQIRFNPSDLRVLHELFGEANVFDFSGTSHITSDLHNYYEPSHYLPAVARQLMDSIYGGTSRDVSLQHHDAAKEKLP